MITIRILLCLLFLVPVATPMAHAGGCGGYYEQVVQSYWVNGYYYSYYVEQGHWANRVSVGVGGQAIYTPYWVDTSYWDGYWVEGYWQRYYTSVWHRDLGCSMCQHGLHG